MCKFRGKVNLVKTTPQSEFCNLVNLVKTTPQSDFCNLLLCLRLGGNRFSNLTTTANERGYCLTINKVTVPEHVQKVN